MNRETRGARAPQPHSKSTHEDREATRIRLGRKGFAILANNADGSVDYYRILSFTVGDGGLRAWYQFGDDELDAPYPIVGFAVILIARGGGKELDPEIAPVVNADGALELARQTGFFVCVARDEAEARAARGMPPRGERAS